MRAQVTTGVDGDRLQFVERLRPNFTAELTERFVLSATVEVALTQGRSLQKEVERTFTASPLGPLLEDAGCVWPRDSNNILSVSFASDYLSVDRLFVDAYLPWADVRAGRQAINWGSAFLVNPTDPFPEVLLLDPWRPRAGVNALRATIPAGEQLEMQAVVGSNDDFTAMRAAARASLTVDVTDFSLIGAWRQETGDGIIGADIRGTLGVGFWLEAALHLDRDPFEEIAVGIDYSFSVLERLLLNAQYYRNGIGTPDLAESGAASNLTDAVHLPDCKVDVFGPAQVDGSPEDRFRPRFRGRDYVMLSAQLGIIPEVSASALWVQNLGDGTAVAVPVVTVAPTGWLEVSAVAQVPLSVWGDGGELRQSEEHLRIDFGAGQVDLTGLVPSATFIVWSRLNF